MHDLPPMIHRAADAPEFYFQEGCFISELANTPDDPSVSIARARVEPGVTTRWHALDGISERYLILSGHGRVDIGDLPPGEVSAGDVVSIPPGCRQRIHNTGDKDLLFLAICSPRFQPSAYREVE